MLKSDGTGSTSALPGALDWVQNYRSLYNIRVLIKAVLMYTAQPLAGYNMLEQGAGEINLEGAVRCGWLNSSELI